MKLNFLDKAIELVNPKASVKRKLYRMQINSIDKITNKGYDESGASRTKKSMKGCQASVGSPKEDIEENLEILRARNRSLYMNAPIARSAINTERTNVIGSGLKLKARIDAEFLGLSEEEAASWKRNTEREFNLWAESKFCDNARLNNFYELQQLAFISYLMNGDCFCLIKHDEVKPYKPYSLKLHLIEADRVSTPSDKAQSADSDESKIKIYSGVELDKDGGVEAYYISNGYGASYNGKWTRVKAVSKETGEANILHIMEHERCEQFRGVPFLSACIEVLKQITRYTEAELTNAVVSSYFTAFIVVKGSTDEKAFSESIEDDEHIQSDSHNYEMGAGTINVLGEGEDIKFGDPHRPASGFTNFFEAMLSQIGAALEIPHELLIKSFKSSYSASRAAMLEAGKSFRSRRAWFANDFCQPVYELFLAEAVARGRINCPGFFSDYAVRKAWSNAQWIGPSSGQIDPKKEVEAAILRVQEGFSTREEETTALTGGNWDDNIKQLIMEYEIMSELRGERVGTEND